MNGPIRVLIADDHAIFRKGIRALLEARAGFQVVGEAANGSEAVEQTGQTSPDVILMDLVMPGMDGIEAIRRITARYPDVRVLVLTSFSADDKLFPAVNAGALGYLLKDSGPEELVAAIQQVYRGESSLHPAIARRVLQEFTHPATRPRMPDPLTEREIEVLKAAGPGAAEPRDRREAGYHRGHGAHPHEQHRGQASPLQPDPGSPVCRREGFAGDPEDRP